MDFKSKWTSWCTVASTSHHNPEEASEMNRIPMRHLNRSTAKGYWVIERRILPVLMPDMLP